MNKIHTFYFSGDKFVANIYYSLGVKGKTDSETGRNLEPDEGKFVDINELKCHDSEVDISHLINNDKLTEMEFLILEELVQEQSHERFY